MSNLSVGIVGLPNVGKSTLFNALLQKQQAMAANYPFATIEPNVGIVPVRDERLPQLAEVVGTEKIIPATVNFTDIAGIVEGASKGEGLGNKFLSHIREVDVILHVLRYFEDSNVVLTGSGDPVSDYVTIETELMLADLESLSKQKEPKGNVSPKDKEKWAVVNKLREALENGKAARDIELKNEEKVIARDLFLLTMKKELYAVNVGEDKVGKKKEIVDEIVSKFRSRGYGIDHDQVVVISAKMEEELSSFSQEEKIDYLSLQGVAETGLDQLIGKCYISLGLMSFLTAGEKEVRAWTIRKGSTAPEAAGVIHSDFEKHFINAKIVKYDDFVNAPGWIKASEQGRVRVVGRDYLMEEDMVVEFVVSV